MAKSLLAILVSALLLSCTEKNIIMPVDGSISGYLRPAVGGAMIRTADSSVTTLSRDDGFFVLQPLMPGIQDIIIDAGGYSRRVLREIFVSAGRTNALGQVSLSHLPYPFFEIDPEDGAHSISPFTYIYLSCDERLDLASLMESAAFTPSVAGNWAEHYPPYSDGSPSIYRYSFSRLEYFSLSTEYTLTIPGSTRLYSGASLERDLVIHFTTAPLTATIGVKALSSTSTIVNLLSPDIRVYFNAVVHIDSLRKAVSIDPPVEGIWVTSASDSVSPVFGFSMPFGSHLRPSTNYAVIVRDDIALSGSHHLGQSALKVFTTNGFAIESPRVGSSVLIGVDGPVDIDFNIPADTAETSAAITIKLSDGTYIPFASSWKDEMRELEITPIGGWVGGATYKVTVSTNARSVEGGRLAYQYEFFVSPRE
jgi:hypothetical protein